jgi:hypothetical protein
METDHHPVSRVVIRPCRPRRVIVRMREGFVRVEPPCHELDRLAVVGHEAEDDPSHGYRITRRPIPLGRQPDRAYQLFPRGLWPVIVFVLEQAGYDLYDTGLGVRPTELPTPDVSRVPTSVVVKPDDIAWLAGQYGGLIEYRAGGIHPLDFVTALVLAYPDASIAIAREKIERNYDVASHLRGHGVQVAVASTRQRPGPETRVVVTTYYGLARAEVEHRQIVIVLDAVEALGHRARFALQFAWRGRLFAMVDAQTRLSAGERQQLQAVFGLGRLRLMRPHEHDRQVDVIWHRIEGGLGNVRSLDPVAVKRQGIWCNQLRNQRVAQAALDLAHPRTNPVNFDTPHEPQTQRVLVLVENIEHALQLASKLPGWPVQTGADVNVTGLNASDRRELDARRAIWPVGRMIVTHAGFVAIDLAEWDVVVRADGGIDSGLLTAEGAISRRGARPPLLLIDFFDRFHPSLKRNSARRRQAYSKQGWFDRGVDRLQAQVELFLDSFRGGPS